MALELMQVRKRKAKDNKAIGALIVLQTSDNKKLERMGRDIGSVAVDASFTPGLLGHLR